MENTNRHHQVTGWAPLVATLTVLGALAATAALAADDKYDELARIRQELQLKEQEKALKEKQQTLLQSQIQNLTRETVTLEDKIEENQDVLREKQTAIDRLQAGIAEQQRAADAQRTVLASLLRSQYETGGTGGADILSLSGTDDDYAVQMQAKVGATLASIAQLRERLSGDQTRLEDERRKAEEAAAKLEQRTSYLESARNYKTYLATQTQKDIKAAEKKIDDLEEEEKEIQREIERIETGKLDDADLSKLPSSKNADFDHPVHKPFRLTQGYGKTSFAKSAAYANNFHNGVDFVPTEDRTIIAPADGRVVATGNMGRYGYGRWAALDHGNGLVTLYGHMSSVKVSRGKKLSKGDTIGIMGSTGYSTGAHLHFTVFAASSFGTVESSRVNGLMIPTGASVNPMKYL